nr:hypothetical protein 2 - lamb's-quarters [Chenopodium album]
MIKIRRLGGVWGDPSKRKCSEVPGKYSSLEKRLCSSDMQKYDSIHSYESLKTLIPPGSIINVSAPEPEMPIDNTETCICHLKRATRRG